MNALTLLNSSVTMTSREIAELTGSRHDNVMTSISRLMEKGVISNPALQDFEEINNLSLPVTRQQFLFSGPDGKRDSIVVVAQLSPEFTGRLVDRWQELESSLVAPARKPVSDPRTAAMIEALYRLDEVEQQQQAMAAQIETTTRALEQIQTAINYFTIVGWHSYKRVPYELTLSLAASRGKEATAYCKNNLIEMGTTPDARFGRVNTYPEWVLDKLFSGEQA